MGYRGRGYQGAVGEQVRRGRDKLMRSSLSPTHITGAHINILINVIWQKVRSRRKTANGAEPGIYTTSGINCELRVYKRVRTV